MDPIESDEKTSEKTSEKTTTSEATSAVSLGEQFKNARDAMGKEIIEVASYLHLAEQVIEDIENDDYSRVASDVYAKGYLKTYAKFVGLSESEILSQYAALELGKTIVSKQPKLIEQKQPILSPKHQRWITYSLMGIFFIVFIYWWTSGAGDSDDGSLLMLEQKKTVKVEQPVKAVKKVEKPAGVTEKKVAENKDKEEEKTITAKVEEPKNLNDVEEKRPLIVSPEDVLSG